MSCGGEAQFRVEARDSGKRIDYSGVRIESESMNIEVSHQPIEIVLKSKSGCPPSLLACDSCLRPGQFLGHYRRARCVHPASVLPGMRILVMPRALPRLKTLRNALITRASPSLSRLRCLRRSDGQLTEPLRVHGHIFCDPRVLGGASDTVL